MKLVWVFLFVSLLSIPFATGIRAVKADSTGSATPYSVVKILSPTNRTYNSRFLTLNVTFPFGGLDYALTYNIDGKNEGSIPWTIDNPNHELHVVYKAIGSMMLPELSEGSHCLTVTIVCGLYGRYGGNPPGAPFKPTSPGSSAYEATWTDSVYFAIDSSASTPNMIPTEDSAPPNISNLSLENKTYLEPDVPLNFSVDEYTSQLTYSLDGKDNVTISGNTTLTDLSIGAHNVTVYAWDDAGNVGASQTIDFAIANVTSATIQTSEPFSTPLVVAGSGVSVIVVGICLLVYFRKRKQTTV
jgi:hypothetical protein